jgi:hypothetical protein
LVDRPDAFYGGNDIVIFREDSQLYQFDNRYDIYLMQNGDDDKLQLHSYICYEEIEIACLFSVSVPTLFINNGNRDNLGYYYNRSDYIRYGIYVGSVGCRFEKPGFMEHKYMICHSSNLKENNKSKIYWGDIFKELLQLSVFKDEYDDNELLKKIFDNKIEETMLSNKLYFHQTNLSEEYLNVLYYKLKMELVIFDFLNDAAARASSEEKTAYVVAVGLGLGVWGGGCVNVATQLTFEIFSKILTIHEKIRNSIACLIFSYFNKADDLLKKNVHQNIIQKFNSGEFLKIIKHFE